MTDYYVGALVLLLVVIVAHQIHRKYKRSLKAKELFTTKGNHKQCKRCGSEYAYISVRAAMPDSIFPQDQLIWHRLSDGDRSCKCVKYLYD